MEWINVKDRFPKLKNRPYLVYMDAYDDPNNSLEISWYDGEFHIPEYPELEPSITHWMPLPEPPKER